MTEQEKEILYAAVMKRANQKDTFGVENGMRIVAMGEGWARGELHTEVRHGNPMGIVHGGVVLVEPAALCRGERVNVDRVEIDRRERQVLEAHKLTIHVLLRFSAEGQVFSADPVAALDVKARLVGCEHSLFQNAGILTFRDNAPADAVRALMDGG